jgi:hypothetical protein
LVATKLEGHVAPVPVVDVLNDGFSTVTKTTALAVVAYKTHRVRTAGPSPDAGRNTTTGSARGGSPSHPTKRMASSVPGGMTSAEGDGVVGVAVGVRVGVVVGCAVVGTTVGCAVVGATVGADVEVGATVVGATVVGSDVGAADAAVGLEEGLRNTISVDCPVP